MSRFGMLCGLALLGLSLVGCGETIGAACTTKSDCGNGICLNGSDNFPGGYCTVQCTEGSANSCPANSVCVADGVSSGIAGCFKACKASPDCREGYSCVANYKGNAHAVCVGAGSH